MHVRPARGTSAFAPAGGFVLDAATRIALGRNGFGSLDAFGGRDELAPELRSARVRQRILFATSEMADFVKTGGLGEVSASLPRFLARLMDVRVMIPGYRQILARCRRIAVVARLPGTGSIPACELGLARLADDLAVYVVLCPELFDRPGSPYSDAAGREWPDNDLRFARLSLAAAQVASGCDPQWRPQALHLNDWCCGLAPAYLHWWGETTPSVFTIHNLAYQGLFASDRIAALGIPAEAFAMDGVEFHGRLSFLKAGLFYASRLTTVSASYAEEITTPAHGCGLHGLLRTRASEGRLQGVVNGMDSSCASSDPHLVGDFNVIDLSGKGRNAAHVRRRFRLAETPSPLFAIVSRLVHQKGIDLVLKSADAVFAAGGQIAAMGQGEPALEEGLRNLAHRHPGSCGVEIGYDETEARRLFAGSDFLLMPSRFEPCGLSQMFAQRFASLPIATATGGLKDTIEDGLTGFLFPEAAPAPFEEAIGRAIATFRRPARLDAMRRAAMGRPHGWEASAREYRALFGDLATGRHSHPPLPA